MPSYIYLYLIISVIICSSLNLSSGTNLCPKDNHWYDDYSGTCKPCEICQMRFLELKSCSDFSNTMCVDLSNFSFLPKTSIPKEELKVSIFENHVKPMRWHEMETMDKNDFPRLRGPISSDIRVPTVQERTDSNQFAKLKHYTLWDIGVIILVCVALASILTTVVILLMKQPGRFLNRKDKRKKSSRVRLFSRDCLSATEYMNNLATLDRRLAMDEILEKRKKAIFEPQLLAENIYTDDVFVDMSGERHYEDLRHDDQEPTRSLLTNTQPTAKLIITRA